VNVSLALLKKQLYAMRSWDSTGETQDNRIRQSLNVALDRMANDVPQALVPDEEHVVLYPDVVSSDSTVDARVVTFASDKRLLEFVDSAGTKISNSSSLTSWRPTLTGEWDGIMHIEITDASGRVHRRQCLEWFTDTVSSNPTDIVSHVVTLDRPYNELITADNQGVAALHFRIHQPEFFVTDDVMEVMEPAKIFDGSRQQVWKIDTAGAGRQDMRDYQGDTSGRPYRCWRGRHYQLPAPTLPPSVVEPNVPEVIREDREPSIAVPDTSASEPLASVYTWADALGLRRGKWAICYTYVWGRKDEDWQLAPSVTPGGDIEQDSTYKLTWAYNKDSSPLTGENIYSGIHDPQFESAPSPVTVVDQVTSTSDAPALVLSAANIDAMMGFGDSAYKRYGRTGLRIRYYVAHLEANESDIGTLNDVETNHRFHLLCEVEPTFDMVTAYADAGTPVPPAFTTLGASDSTAARVIWTGAELYDYHRTLKHSTGYYAWKVFPHQDARYELDFRVSRLPKKYINDQDTAPIHPEAIPTLIELALYYVSLVDGNDQISAQAHLNRYQDLVRVFRDRYANPGGIVEPVSISGYSHRHRYGTFSSSE
tara:strand:- start:672 stop:2456 length:1785 start_codon:yes stop_codon:yes gene_type:complete